MSIESLAWALSVQVENSTTKLVLLGLANHAHADGTVAYASTNTLAVYAGCSPRTVSRHLRLLMDAGLIREGDQGHVQHLRPDRRPVVYNVAMSEHRQQQWVEAGPGSLRALHEAQGGIRRGDNLTPRTDERGANPDQSGVSPVTKRGAIVNTNGVSGVAPKPSLEPPREPSLEPSPDAALIDFPLQHATQQSRDQNAEQTHFDKWWAVWPKKEAKKEGRKAYSKAYRNVGPTVLMDALLVQLGKLKQEEARGGFCPFPATWLNGERWEDEMTDCPEQPIPNGRGTNGALHLLQQRMASNELGPADPQRMLP